MSETTVAPHPFEPLRRFFNRGRCRHCYMPQELHPFGPAWVIARPLGDKAFRPLPKPPLQSEEIA